MCVCMRACVSASLFLIVLIALFAAAVDCARPPNKGCSGGYLDMTMQWIADHNGLCSDAEYPYVAANTVCKVCTPVVQLSGYHSVSQFDDAALEAAVRQQPVVVGIRADEVAPRAYFFASKYCASLMITRIVMTRTL